MYVSLHLTDDPTDQEEFKQMLNQKHPCLNLLLAHGMIVAGVDTDGSYITIDMEYPNAEPEASPQEVATEERQETTTRASSRTDTYVMPESPQAPASADIPVPQDRGDDDRDEKGHAKNTSPQALAVRRAKLRNIFKAIRESTTGTFDDVFAQYESVYSRNRVAVWLWIFENKGWVRFDERWTVTKEPTDNDLDEVLRAYLERHGNYDTPDDTCLKDILKREEGRENVRTPKVKNVIPTVKDQTEMSWPEMKKAYAEKRAAGNQNEPEKAPAPTQAYAGKAHRVDWEKILDGVRDILFDATEPMTATSIRRERAITPRHDRQDGARRPLPEQRGEALEPGQRRSARRERES